MSVLFMLYTVSGAMCFYYFCTNVNPVQSQTKIRP